MGRVGAALVAALLACAAGDDRDAPPGRIRAAVGFLEEAPRAMLESELALLARETGVDLYVTFAELEEGAELARQAADGLDRRPPLSAGPPTHAALLLHDLRSRVTRLEVGYGLDPLVPAALAGAWLDGHTQLLLRRNRAYEALLLTARMLQDRIRHASLDGGFEPNPPRRRAGLRYRSGGGGATSRAIAPPRDPGPPRPATGAWASVDDSHASYLEWLQAGDPRQLPALFTDETRAYLADFPLTAGYLEFVAEREAGRAYRVLERGDRALLFFVDDPFLAPHFLRETSAGWKLDLVSEVREVVNLAGGPYSWSFRAQPGASLEPFTEALVDVDGVRRVAGGDNRPAVVFRRPE